MANAVIKSDRPAAAVYNGMAARLVRKVEKGDMAFDDKQAQVIAIVNDREHYFYADEVVKGDSTRHVMTREEMPHFDRDRHAATPDQAAWDNANTMGSVTGMEEYLMRFPAGTHSDEARQKRSQMAPGLPQLAPLPKEFQPPKPPEPAADSKKDVSGKDGSAIAAANVGTAIDEDRTGQRVQTAEAGVEAPPPKTDPSKSGVQGQDPSKAGTQGQDPSKAGAQQKSDGKPDVPPRRF